MFGLGLPEMLVIAVIVLLIFGAKRLPQIGKGLGKTAKEIKDISRDMKKDKERKQKGENEEEESPEKAEGEETLLDGIKPVAKDIKDIKKKADTLRKWSRFLR